MKLEKLILSIIGIFFGLLVAGSAFYFYQRITFHTDEKKIVGIAMKKTATPTPTPSFFITVDSPKDESVSDTKTITVSGTTIPSATVIVSSPSVDQVLNPSTQGTFSTTIALDSDENQIVITAIALSGEQIQKKLSVTYSTQDF